MLNYANGHQNVMAALPMIQREVLKLPRYYIANVIYTIVGEEFANWVNRRVNIRNKKVPQEENMIELDPEIFEIYQKSTSVSV